MFNRKFTPGTKTKTKTKVSFSGPHTCGRLHVCVCVRTYVRLRFWLPAPRRISLPTGVPRVCVCRR